MIPWWCKKGGGPNSQTLRRSLSEQPIITMGHHPQASAWKVMFIAGFIFSRLHSPTTVLRLALIRGKENLT